MIQACYQFVKIGRLYPLTRPYDDVTMMLQKWQRATETRERMTDMKTLAVALAVMASLFGEMRLSGPDAGLTVNGQFVQFEYLDCYASGAEMFEDGSCVEEAN